MTVFLALAATFVLSVLAVFQIALIFGAPLGRYAWGGSHVKLPRKLRIASVFSIFLYALFAIVILSKAGAIDAIQNPALINIGMWAITAYLFFGIIMNSISRSKRERDIMTPVASLLAMLFLLVAISTT